MITEGLEINQRFDEAKLARQEALEASIDPDVSTEAKLQVVMATADQLMRLADLSLSTDDEDGVFLVLRAARQNPNLEDVPPREDLLRMIG